MNVMFRNRKLHGWRRNIERTEPQPFWKSAMALVFLILANADDRT